MENFADISMPKYCSKSPAWKRKRAKGEETVLESRLDYESTELIKPRRAERGVFRESSANRRTLDNRGFVVCRKPVR